jgi:release factor glutamine methyltransferase
MITPDVLVPRPDTEELVDAVLEWAKDKDEGLRIVDVGTGSGIIAVSLAHKLPSAHITAIDVSEPAVEIARANALRHGVANRMDFLASNLLDAVEGPFDVITANLPYIEQPTLADNPVAKWEPIVALDGGSDGLVLIRQMLAQAPSRLAPGGAVFLEIGYDQGESGAALCQSAFPNAEVEVRSDLAELDRVIIIRT